MKSFYPKGNWVKWKSRIEESVESLIKWAFEKTVNKSWQNRWANNKSLYSDTDVYKPHGPEIQDCAAYFFLGQTDPPVCRRDREASTPPSSYWYRH